MEQPTGRQILEEQFDEDGQIVAPDLDSLDAEADEASDEPEVEEFTAFDPRHREAFEGVMWLGHLEDSFEAFGHSFTIKTLTAGEKLAVARLIMDFERSVAYGRAFHAACAAASLLLIDGRPVPVAQKPGPDGNPSIVRQKYEWLVNSFYEPVIEVIFSKLDALEAQVLEVLAELGIPVERREVVEQLD
jgi:hypothetical protein